MVLKGIPSFLALAVSVCTFAQEITPVGSEPSSVTVEVKASQQADYSIPQTIFGSFLEPIGNSTYNGLWAEVLENPSFENGLWDASHTAQMTTANPALARASRLALPLPWEPLDAHQANRYEPRRGDAANSSQSLAILGVPGHATGIKQRIFLPVYREMHYHGSLFIKSLSGAARISISIRKRDNSDLTLARSVVDASSAEWRKYEFDLILPPDRLVALEPADFVIALEAGERVLVDQVSLMPSDAPDGLDPEMVSLAKAMHTPLVRFGGNFTSGYHWQDGVGARDKRVSTRNIAWGIPETNQFGTDEFLRFCELIGAEPQIALNLGSGTAAEAGAWVRYVNQHWSRHTGLLWELGNELWGEWNLGYPTLEELPGRTRAFSQAVREADPHARLIATGQDPDHFQTWNAAQLTNPAGTFEFLSTHFVVGTDRVAAENATPDAIAAAAFALPVELGRRLRAMQAQIDESQNFRNKTKIAFTEWLFNCCHGAAAVADAPRWDNMGGAVAAGGLFNMLLRNADIVPISDMTGIIEFAGIWKKRGRAFATPSYYVFRMYATAEPDVTVGVESNSGAYDVKGGISRLPTIANVPYLDVVAVRNKPGNRLTIFCVNRHLNKDITTDISITGFTAAGNARVQELSAASIYEVNDEVNPKHIVPAESTVPLEHGWLRFTFRHASVTRIDIPK